jgi:hypothetical protein
MAPNVEVDSDVEGYHHIISCWNVSNGALVPNGILGDHNCNSPGIHTGAEAAIASWIHEASLLTKVLLEGEQTIGNIKLIIAIIRVVNDHHDWNTTVLTCIRYESWSLLHIICVQL